MSIPVATTTIDVLRRAAGDALVDTWDQPALDDFTVSTAGVRASISAPSGRETVGVTQQSEVQYRLAADPCDLQHVDHVVDRATGTRYEVIWASAVRDLGTLDHTVAGLRLVTGAPT